MPLTNKTRVRIAKIKPGNLFQIVVRRMNAKATMEQTRYGNFDS